LEDFIVTRDSYINIKWTDLSQELGKALIIASILSATVDIFLKKRLASEITRDAFKAAMGYVFPEEIRDEVRWFYGFPLLASRRAHHFTLTRIHGTDYVQVVSSDNATIRNISNTVAVIEVQIHADEWEIENRPTALVELGYQHKGKRVESAKEPPERIEHKNRSVQWKYGEIKLAAKGDEGDSIDIWRKITETKHINDNVWWVALWPSINPEIRIVAPDLEYHVDYVRREGRASLIEYGKGSFRLSGTILPSQVLIVR